MLVRDLVVREAEGNRLTECAIRQRINDVILCGARGGVFSNG